MHNVGVIACSGKRKEVDDSDSESEGHVATKKQRMEKYSSFSQRMMVCTSLGLM